VRARRLTPAQRGRIPVFIDKWIQIGRSTAPIDHDRAERALGQLYMSAGLIAPQVVWAPCPLTAILSAIVYTTIRIGGKEEKARIDSAVAEITGQITQSSLVATAAPSVHRAMQLSVERTVATALACSCRIWSGFDPTLAINSTRRAALERRIARALDDRVHKTLDTRLATPIRAGVASLGRLLEPALNLVGHGALRIRIRQAALAYSGAPFWVPYAAKMDYIHQLLGIALDRSFIDAVESCGLFWMLDGICFAAERPSYANRDEAGQLHCEVGPAIAYPSGWSWWQWHGVEVPQMVIEEPERITVGTIRQVRQPALRHVMLERYRCVEETHGIAAYLRDSEAQPLDRDDSFGTLWRLDGAGASMLMVEVTNHSPEPDGAYRHFFLQVHPELRPILADGTYGAPQPRTVRNAVASTFGLTGAAYAPEVET
jgi:hypothetical protein